MRCLKECDDRVAISALQNERVGTLKIAASVVLQDKKTTRLDEGQTGLQQLLQIFRGIRRIGKYQVETVSLRIPGESHNIIADESTTISNV